MEVLLTDFTIKNFRGIKELTLPKLARVNLFVGKNGAGKTSVLGALELWAAGRANSACKAIPAGGLAVSDASRYWSEVVKVRWDIAAALRTVLPNVEDVCPDPGGGSLLLMVGLAGERERVPIDALGGGAKRIFELALSLVAARNGLLLIDEVENGLHYGVIGEVWKFLLGLAEEHDVQVFATTHSRDTVYALAEASQQDDHIVYRLQERKGHLHAVSFDHRDLRFAVEEELEVR